ncbi:MAG: DUF503 domain-containing protein [Planctomycetota bacterium]|jgi:uncharacterized protein YlxP (DUF503 family)
MIIGTVVLKLSIRDARSLKDKRRVIKSLKDRLRNSFNVSVAEIDAQDIYQSAVLAAAMVGSDRRYVEGALSKIIDFTRSARGADLLNYETEIF